MLKKILIMTLSLFFVYAMAINLTLNGNGELPSVSGLNNLTIDNETVANQIIEESFNSSMTITADDLNAKFAALKFKVDNVQTFSPPTSCADLSTTQDIFGNLVSSSQSACVLNGCIDDAGTCIDTPRTIAQIDEQNVSAFDLSDVEYLDVIEFDNEGQALSAKIGRVSVATTALADSCSLYEGSVGGTVVGTSSGSCSESSCDIDNFTGNFSSSSTYIIACDTEGTLSNGYDVSDSLVLGGFIASGDYTLGEYPDNRFNKSIPASQPNRLWAQRLDSSSFINQELNSVTMYFAKNQEIPVSGTITLKLQKWNASIFDGPNGVDIATATVTIPPLYDIVNGLDAYENYTPITFNFPSGTLFDGSFYGFVIGSSGVNYGSSTQNLLFVTGFTPEQYPAERSMNTGINGLSDGWQNYSNNQWTMSIDLN